ncbi:MAG: hypothetical protein H0W65_01065 [Sphingomonas sp.]|uniref:hypothetical protein n=1 Tax=Sphingomonas sp. TaxID=28214 RepID=UPI0017B78CE4|nr:hypothetical protein [Sphingomonas sp.]MBA3666301.1 hypothetical protein [Sphingomonas sp.]
MGEPKAFASLSSGLLARKGAARPAMRPQGFGQIGSGLDDLGWDDMGFEPPKPALTTVRDAEHDAFGDELAEPALRNPLAALTPIPSPVHDQQAEIAGRFAAHEEDGEEEDGDYVDETAELYDPETDEAHALDVVVETAPEPAPLALIPVLATKASASTVQAPKTNAVPVRRAVRPRVAAGGKAKSAFTLRLDPSRHLKLRLACAVTGRSAQQLVTDALDQLLTDMPELESMAERAPRARRAEG